MPDSIVEENAQGPARPAPDSRSRLQSSQRWLAMAALLVGLALRLFQLGAQSLWYDETVSVYLARLPLPVMLAHTAGDIHPPGYYALLHAWQLLTTPTLAHGLEFLYAWPSAAAGLLMMALLYAVGRRLFGASAALAALWLAAVNPFQLWYSQEVRMYTLAAALGLFCLWALLQFLSARRRAWWLAAYVLAAAAGLYTLYYFAFLLAALNVMAMGVLWLPRRPQTPRGRLTMEWIGAQVVVLLLWLPWLPVFWRQMTAPPVPPWRIPWNTWAAFIGSASESLAALLVGQSPPGAITWPWAAVSGGLLLLFLFLAVQPGEKTRRTTAAASGDPQPNRLAGALLVTVYVFVPAAIICLVTLFITPIYHVRYFAFFAPAYMLAAGAVVVWLAQWQRWIGAAAGLILAAISCAGLVEFWSNPIYQADDHRAAVAALAANWRPGDVILANAGWIYPILSTYWPTEAVGADAVTPPPLGDRVRLHDYTNYRTEDAAQPHSPLLLLTGSVDGSAQLGWGSPASDFFAMPAHDAVANLAAATHDFRRIWHYRVYDTVSDPTGVLRRWLAAHTTLRSEQPIPGRDFGLVQLFETASRDLLTAPPQQDVAAFDGALTLLAHTTPVSVPAGSPLYVELMWQPQPGLAGLHSNLAMSLRLYTRDGQLAAQADAAPAEPTAAWAPGSPVRQPLALPLPAALEPGAYSLELVVYHQENGSPLALEPGPRVVDGQRWQLGRVAVEPPAQSPAIDQALAAFDYIDLVAAALPPTGQAGAPVSAALTWRPRASSYRDTYRAVITLRDAGGRTIQEWRRVLGGDAYPSGAWPPNLPVRDLAALDLPSDLAPGRYQWVLRVERASDGQPIPAQQGWNRRDELPVGTLQITG